MIDTFVYITAIIYRRLFRHWLVLLFLRTFQFFLLGLGTNGIKSLPLIVFSKHVMITNMLVYRYEFWINNWYTKYKIIPNTYFAFRKYSGVYVYSILDTCPNAVLLRTSHICPIVCHLIHFELGDADNLPCWSMPNRLDVVILIENSTCDKRLFQSFSCVVLANIVVKVFEFKRPTYDSCIHLFLILC